MSDPMTESGGPAEAADAGPEAAGGTPAQAWPDDLPAELAKAAGKFATPVAALKSYVELERRLGRALVLPEPDADEAEQRRFHRRLGVPDRPEDYAVRFPLEAEGPEEEARQTRFLTAMQSAGAPPSVVQAALDWFDAEAASLTGARDGLAARAEAEAEAELRADWGPAFERNLALARRVLSCFGADEGTALAETSLGGGGRLGSHPGFLRLLQAVGGGMLEDQALIGQPETAGQVLRERIDALHGLPPEQYKAEAVQSELRGLYRRLQTAEAGDGAGGS